MTRRHTALLALVLWIAGLAVLAGSASGKIVHEQEGTFPLGGINFLTVDNSSGPSAGSLYIGEINGATFETRVYQADATGAPTGVELDAAETPAGSLGLINLSTFKLAGSLAVDSSSGANAGDIYVPDIANGVVDRFDEAGKYVCQITGLTTPSGSECAGAAGSETPRGGLEPQSVAVDPRNGRVAVGDASGVIYLFNPVGEYEGEIADAAISEPFSLAFDSTGSLYVVNANIFGAGPGNAVKFDPAGAFAYTLAPSRFSVGVDLGNDHVYLGGALESGNEVREFDAAGNPLSSFGDEGAISIGVNKTTGQVYLTMNGQGEIWSGDLFFPSVSTGVAAPVAETGATLHGSVDPEISTGGSAIESCEFEYGETEAYGQAAPCTPSTPYTVPTDVEAPLSGLAPSTTYHYRLAAENANGERGTGEDQTLTTSGPAGISGEVAIARTSSATVRAQINPFGSATTCEVQYVDDARFQASGYTDAAAVPCAEALAAGFGDQPVTATLSGLSIGTVYHYRFVAKNAAGTRPGADQTFSTFGIESFSIEAVDAAGQPYTQAGGHPYAMKVKFSLSTTAPESAAEPKSVTANLRTVQVELPPGLIGNPQATQRCPANQVKPKECSGETQVGMATVQSARGGGEFGPVYNLTPPRGVAAQLGARFNAFGSARIDAGVRTGADYGVRADSLFVTADEGVSDVEVILWGIPADAGHSSERFCPGEALPGCPSDAPLRPFLTNPTSCLGSLSATMRVDAWQEAGNFDTAGTQLPGMTGCEQLKFEPTIAVQPDVRTLDSPAGLHVDLHIPQDESPTGLATANLKDATVTLPPGMTVNPSGANGLAACSPAQVDLHGPGPAACPDAAKVGRVEVRTPLLDHPLPGAVYVATPHDNPFDSLLAIYVAVHDPQSGVVVKLAGKVSPDPQTGQLTTTFRENPQLPFEDFELDFFGGRNAALMTPQTCGRHTTDTVLTPWSGNADAHPSDSAEIDSGPNGSACVFDPAKAPHQPSFSAGAVTPLAGSYSPFVLHLSRADGSQRLQKVGATLPPGQLAKLAGVPYCPQGSLDAAGRNSGRAEQAAPSCPAASRVGGVAVAAGAGPQPYHVAGTVYLAGPYRGAPLSLAIVTPAVAGPFDLGTVVVRTALDIDPVTARANAVSDPIPMILEGVPLDVRSISLNLDRPQFTLNPTSCDPMAVEAAATSVFGQVAPLTGRFQLGGCRALGFAPKLATRLFGPTKRGGYPRLRAVLTAKPGQANIARTAVTLPRSEFLAQEHIRTVCTRVQFAADQCPKGSVYGFAKAWTTLLDQPLTGPVYLRSNGGERELPDLVAALRGPASQPIEIDVVGFVDSVGGGIRTRFESVPDAPVSKFVLTMKGGAKGLLVNSRNICRSKSRVTVRMSAHNGKQRRSRPLLRAAAGERGVSARAPGRGTAWSAPRGDRRGPRTARPARR